MAREKLRINGTEIAGGSRQVIDLPIAPLYTHAPMTMPVHVIRGKRNGPRLFISAAIHGDEINGVEIIRRLLKLPTLAKLKGDLLVIPIVNVHGFINQSRYLPDRRDLNRSFPGSKKGSMAARLADLFMQEIVANSDFGIDLHTAAIHRDNLPQIRANLEDERTETLCHAFGVPVIIDSALRDGSLREAACEQDVPLLVYEAGEALRFDEFAIKAGLKGIVNVMRHLGMLPKSRRKYPPPKPFVARNSSWVRADTSGTVNMRIKLGDKVDKGQTLCGIYDPFGGKEVLLKSPYEGIIIGRTNLPLINEGDALIHIARFHAPDDAAAEIEQFQETYSQ